MIKIIAFLIGFAVSAFMATRTAAFFEQDSCLDASGKIEPTTGACVLDPGSSYVPLLSRPDRYAFWALFIALVVVPGWLSSWILQKALVQIRHRFDDA